MDKIKTIISSLIGLVLSILLLCTLRTYFFLEDKTLDSFVNLKTITIGDESWERFAQSIRIPTVAGEAGVINETASDEFLRYLKTGQFVTTKSVGVYLITASDMCLSLLQRTRLYLRPVTSATKSLTSAVF